MLIFWQMEHNKLLHFPGKCGCNWLVNKGIRIFLNWDFVNFVIKVENNTLYHSVPKTVGLCYKIIPLMIYFDFEQQPF